MATSATLMDKKMSTPLLIALVTLKGYEETQKGKELYIKDLTQYLVDLRKGGVDIQRIALSGVPGDYWSEDIAQFVSEGIVFGDIKHRSPLEFTEKCVEVCKKAISGYINEDDTIKPLIIQAKNVLALKDLSL